MRHTVRLKKRWSKDETTFTYYLDYTDETGKRRRTSLGHSNKRKAEQQRLHKQRQMFFVSVRLAPPADCRIDRSTAEPGTHRLSRSIIIGTARWAVPVLFGTPPPHRPDHHSPDPADGVL